jgi:hypothetical protein
MQNVRGVETERYQVELVVEQVRLICRRALLEILVLLGLAYPPFSAKLSLAMDLVLNREVVRYGVIHETLPKVLVSEQFGMVS